MHTFAEDQIPFSESFKRKEGIVNPANGESLKLPKNGAKDLVEHSGSNTHTFGRRSRAGAEGGEPEADDDDDND